MKRQGIEGFTFDSKAEEWAHWAKSCLRHNRPTSGRAVLALYELIDATEARHSPAQPQNTVGIGEGSGRGDNRALWGLLAVAIIALVCAAGMMGWL